jgi:large subunit ribosomal protein L21
MYAIITTGGKQHRVKVGQKHRFELIVGNPGDSIELGEALLIGDGDKIKVGAPSLSGSKVVGTIVEHGRGDKIRIVKMRRRKGYRRTQGHRQGYTLVEITGINH